MRTPQLTGHTWQHPASVHGNPSNQDTSLMRTLFYLKCVWLHCNWLYSVCRTGYTPPYSATPSLPLPLCHSLSATPSLPLPLCHSLSAACRLEPGNLSYLWHKASIYQLMNDSGKAVSAYQQLLQVVWVWLVWVWL